MANVAMQLTGQSTPSGRIPFLQYTPSDLSIRQPLIIYLHGQGNRSTVHDTTSVLLLDNAVSGDPAQGGIEGLPWLTNSINPRTGGILPHYTDAWGLSREPYCLSPQLYGNPGLNSTLWQDYYVLQMIKYAKTSLYIDPTMIYLTGYSLGMGGTIVACMNPLVNIQLAAAFGNSPGYGTSGTPGNDHQTIAESGLPIWWAHANNDTVALIGVSHTIYNKIMAAKPLCPVRFTEYTTGNHGIQGRMFDERIGTSYPLINGENMVHNPNMFQWLFRHKRIDNIPPIYR
jgi:predicted peptidase